MGVQEWSSCGKCTRWLRECNCGIFHSIAEDVDFGDTMEKSFKSVKGGDKVLERLNSVYRRIDHRIYMTNDMMDAVKSCNQHRVVFETKFHPIILSAPLIAVWNDGVVIVDRNVRARGSYDFLVVFYGVCMNALREGGGVVPVWTCNDLNSFMIAVRKPRGFSEMCG